MSTTVHKVRKASKISREARNLISKFRAGWHENGDDLSDDEVELENKIIIGKDYLNNFIVNNMVCKTCHSPLSLSFATRGLATVIACSCTGESECHQTILIPDNKQLEENVFNDPTEDEINFIEKCSTLDFYINNMFMLSLLCSGNGYQYSRDLCGFLELQQPWSSCTYQKCEDKICKIAKEIGETIMNENIEKEKRNVTYH